MICIRCGIGVPKYKNSYFCVPCIKVTSDSQRYRLKKKIKLNETLRLKSRDLIDYCGLWTKSK